MTRGKTDRTGAFWHSLDAAERKIIQSFIDAAGGTLSDAARLAGVRRNFLYRRMTRLGMHVPKPKLVSPEEDTATVPEKDTVGDPGWETETTSA